MNPIKVTCYTQSKVNSIAASYKADEEILVKEEQKAMQQLQSAQDEKARITQEKKSLKPVEEPGEEPDFEKYMSSGFIEGLGSLWAGILMLVFMFHCAIWVLKHLFDIPWDTWGWTKTWFLYGVIGGIGISVIVAIIYWLNHSIWNDQVTAYNTWMEKKESLQQEDERNDDKIHSLEVTLENIESNRKAVLLEAYHSRLNLPVKSLEDMDYVKTRQTFFNLLNKKNRINDIPDPIKKISNSIDFYNQKLQAFFSMSLLSEAPSKEVLKTFNSLMGKNRRQMVTPNEISKNNVSLLIKSDNQYSEDILDDIVDDFCETMDMDTSGVFTKHSSSLLEQQVNLLERSYKKALNIYDSYSATVHKVNFALGIARMMAYRNLYLGLELLNIRQFGIKKKSKNLVI